MEDMGVIMKIQEPTDWCAGMVVVPKPNGKVRICVDLTNLNQSVQRERHPLPAIDQILAQLAGAKVFSTLDANSGFWQIPLDPESAKLMHNLHYSVWAILFPQATLRNNLSSRTFPTPNDRDPEWDTGSGLHDG
jgi:hypothetical protein